MGDEPYTRLQKIWFVAMLGILIVAIAFAIGPMVEESLGALVRGDVVRWPWMLPFIPFFLVIVAILGARLLAQVFFRKYDPEQPEEYNKPVFHRHEGRIMMMCVALAFIAPLVVQPAMDNIVFPALGYTYCEALSEKTETFGFDIYSYVPDVAMCVEPLQQG